MGCVALSPTNAIVIFYSPIVFIQPAPIHVFSHIYARIVSIQRCPLFQALYTRSWNRLVR